jgi:cell wall assembly regulator SMI1
LSSLHDYATWEPLLTLLSERHTEDLSAPDGHVAGQIAIRSASLPGPRTVARAGQPPEDWQRESEAVARVRDALAEAGLESIAFLVQLSPAGRAVLHLHTFGPAVESGLSGAYPGALLLVEGALPEPWRRLPEPMPAAAAAPSADVALLERTLRERLPEAVGATDAEFAATRARLGIALPEELKVLYRVVRARREDYADDRAAAWRTAEAVSVNVFPLDDVYVADAASRPLPWPLAAKRAAAEQPDAAVQNLVGSPGWIVFGDNGGGDCFAVDLTPGRGGCSGQIIMINHEDGVGASLVAHSLTDLVLGRESDDPHTPAPDAPPVVAHVNIGRLPSIEAAAHPGLEVLSLGVWEEEPLSLAPVFGLPRLRTLAAHPGTLADPLEIAELTQLEFLELAPEDWRVLLDADAVPRTLSAAAILTRVGHHPRAIVALANELLARWDRPLITHTVLEP